MILQILAAILILAITAFQVVQGLFSALIMTILTIICAALAFNYYEPLAAVLYEWQPAHADGMALLALFIIPLIVLRTVIDLLIKNNVVTGMWTDRVGGGVLGLITAMVLVGMMMISLQMLPFGESILTCKAYDANLERNQRLAPFYPDEFTLSLVNTLSNTGLGAGKSFTSIHDDLLLEGFCARNTGGADGRLSTKTTALKLIAAYEPSTEQIEAAKVEDWADLPANKRLKEGAVVKTVILRVSVDELARDSKDDWYRLPATQFRLVSQTGRSYYPLAYLTAWQKPIPRSRRDSKSTQPDINWKAIRAPWMCHVPPVEEGTSQRASLVVSRNWDAGSGPKQLVVDWVYRLPQDEKLDFVAFRRVARQEIKKSNIEDEWPPVPNQKGKLDRLTRVAGVAGENKGRPGQGRR